ncbi:hypothetical protein GCM10007893_28950 [Paracoccus marinus]|nr:hypothetical protein GCM10007893_28950 [Paracoccus marinus]
MHPIDKLIMFIEIEMYQGCIQIQTNKKNSQKSLWQTAGRLINGGRTMQGSTSLSKSTRQGNGSTLDRITGHGRTTRRDRLTDESTGARF